MPNGQKNKGAQALEAPLPAESAGLPDSKEDYTPPVENLRAEHWAMLEASAISAEVARERGYKTVTNSADLRELGFSIAQSRQTPGLLLPLHSTDGKVPLFVYRPDNPRVIEDKRGKRNPDGTYPNDVIKYEIPKWAGVRLDCPPRCMAALGNPGIPLWVTEGQKKADALASAGLAAISLLGVWNFKGHNEYGGSVFLADWDYIALNGRKVHIVYDSDVMTKPNVSKALERLMVHLQRRGAVIGAVYLPGGSNGKVGVDDWLADGHAVEDLENLVEAPRPMPRAAPPRAELLDNSPVVIRRPVALIDGRGYAAVWPFVKLTITERLGSDGKIYLLSQPEEKIERQLHIVRDDGSIFGPGGRDFRELGLDISLPEIPLGEKLWSTPGIKAFLGGERPAPADVFQRLMAVINRFIDFDRSLADQETMTQLMACFVMSSWMLDASSVAGFLWINGESGCGKTTLLLTIAELAHLGQALSPSGSFASLRDLADYGATLGLDDAEVLTDPQKSDPDKRAVLLSGNRRGVTVPLKEVGPNGQWVTRNVNTFCPRVFSAIAKPDPVLSSRVLIIPLARTAERRKGNADPLDYSQWPYNRQKLIDDLWALSVSRIRALPEFDDWVRTNAELIGRDLQPWQAILSVAAWLDQNGMPGLWEKLEHLASHSYQDERDDIEIGSENRLLVRALGEFARSNPDKREWIIPTEEVVKIMRCLIHDEELDLDSNEITTRKMGRKIKQMRFKRDASARPRAWHVGLGDLVKQFRAYALPLPKEIEQKMRNQTPLPIPLNGNNGNNGNNGAIIAI